MRPGKLSLKNNKKQNLLVVDDEVSMRELLDMMLTKAGYQITCAENGHSAVALIQKINFDLILCDIRLGDITGIEVLKKAKEHNPHTVVIVISAYASAENAVEAMNNGAYDYLPKPFDNNELKQTIAKALEMRTIENEKIGLSNILKENLHFGIIVGNHPKMLEIYKMIMQVAKTRTNILVTGESGTGKELIARAIHSQSKRSHQPFVAINCGGIPETLMESELFGHKKGSFTGASHDKKGLFETAHLGTVFLDEIGEISSNIQVKLLRAVQEKVFKPVGANENISVDIRIISATNKKLEKEVIEGNFREDLFYRLNVIEIKMPPLRERKSDLKTLAQHFLKKYSQEMEKEITKVSSYAIDLLHKYDFPGNIRELENLIERSVALTSTNIILPDSLAMSFHKRRWKEGSSGKLFDPETIKIGTGVDLDKILAQMETLYLEKALKLTNGNKNKAAALLKINLRSMRYRMDKLNIE